MTQSPSIRTRSASRTGALILALVIIAAGIGCVLGLPGWVILVLAALPWVELAFARFGGFFAVIVFVFGEFWGLLASLMLTSATKLPMLATVEIIWALVGLVGAWMLWRRDAPTAWRSVRGAFLAVGLPSLLGGFIWVAVLAVAQFIPRSARLAWAMLGDSANNILTMRDMLRDGGLIVGPLNNPVPLPDTLLTVLTASGRGQIAQSDLLRHDVAALALSWSVLIVLCTLASGLTVAFLARSVGARTSIVAIAAAGASLLPLAWFFTGEAIDDGFLDAELAIPLVLLTFLAYARMRDRPALSLALLTVSATLLLAVWSPLVLIPALFAAVIVLQDWRQILRVRGVQRTVLALGLLQLIVYGAGVSLPNLLRYGHLLSTPGGIFHYRNWMSAALAAAAIALALAAYRRFRHPIVLGLLMLIVAGGAALGILLFGSRDAASPWTYYPVKLAWLCSGALVVLIVGLAVSVLVTWVRPIALQLGGLVVIAAVTIAFFAWAPTSTPTATPTLPVVRVLAGEAMGSGDDVADQIFRYATPTHSVILWNTGGAYESNINFWAWEMWGNSLRGHTPLRVASYEYYVHMNVKELCRIVKLLGGGSTVYTAKPGLADDVAAACPAQHARVVVLPAHSHVGSSR